MNDDDEPTLEEQLKEKYNQLFEVNQHLVTELRETIAQAKRIRGIFEDQADLMNEIEELLGASVVNTANIMGDAILMEFDMTKVMIDQEDDNDE